jgi:hypothetical protein
VAVAGQVTQHLAADLAAFQRRHMFVQCQTMSAACVLDVSSFIEVFHRDIM